MLSIVFIVLKSITSVLKLVHGWAEMRPSSLPIQIRDNSIYVWVLALNSSRSIKSVSRRRRSQKKLLQVYWFHKTRHTNLTDTIRYEYVQLCYRKSQGAHQCYKVWFKKRFTVERCNGIWVVKSMSRLRTLWIVVTDLSTKEKTTRRRWRPSTTLLQIFIREVTTLPFTVHVALYKESGTV